MIQWHESVPSTMQLAAALAAEGCPAFTAVAAEEQTAGQGRHGRSWHSPAGGGLYASIVLRLEEPPPLVTLALGLAVRHVLIENAGVTPDLRWPNDVMLGEQKLAGILTQLHDGAIIAGIGLNVNHTEFPAELATIATSLRIATGREHDRRALLEALVERVRATVSLSPEEIRRSFTAASTYATGKQVFVEEMNLGGVTAGLTEEGFLLVRDTCGGVHTVVAGGVRAARS